MDYKLNELDLKGEIKMFQSSFEGLLQIEPKFVLENDTHNSRWKFILKI